MVSRQARPRGLSLSQRRLASSGLRRASALATCAAVVAVLVSLATKARSAFTGSSSTRSRLRASSRRWPLAAAAPGPAPAAVAAPPLAELAETLGVDADVEKLARAISALKLQLAEVDASMPKAKDFATRAEALEQDVVALEKSSKESAQRLEKSLAGQGDLQTQLKTTKESFSTVDRELAGTLPRIEALNRTLQAKTAEINKEGAESAEKLANSENEKEQATVALTRLQKEGKEAEKSAKTLLSCVKDVRGAVTTVLVEAGVLRNPETDAALIEKEADAAENKADEAEKAQKETAAKLEALGSKRGEVQELSQKALDNFQSQEQEIEKVKAEIEALSQGFQRIANKAGAGDSGGLLSNFFGSGEKKEVEEVIADTKKTLSALIAKAKK